MKIQRMVDGKRWEFALTNEEIYQAYLLQEREFDRQDVHNEVYEMDEEDRQKFSKALGINPEAFLAKAGYVDRIARDMRTRMEKQDIDKETAFWQAVYAEQEYVDEEAERDIDLKEAEFGADGWRMFGGRDDADIDDDRFPLEQLGEMSYRERFNMVLAMEFPETIDEGKLQDALYERFMEDDSETGFFTEGFRAAAEKEIDTYQKDRQKELEGIDDILII